MCGRMNRAEAAEVERMLFGNGAARLRVGHDWEMREFRKLGKFSRLRKPNATAGQKRGTLGLAQPAERFAQSLAARASLHFRPVMFGEWNLRFLGAAEQHIDRQFEEHRSRPA